MFYTHVGDVWDLDDKTLAQYVRTVKIGYSCSRSSFV